MQKRDTRPFTTCANPHCKRVYRGNYQYCCAVCQECDVLDIAPEHTTECNHEHGEQGGRDYFLAGIPRKKQ